MGANSGTSADVISALEGAPTAANAPQPDAGFRPAHIADVAQTFAYRCVLVTGGSGFLGKVLVEKLLYSIPDIKRIYLIIRPSKHETPKERLQKILQNPLFNRIRYFDATLFDKLVPISGDFMKPNMNLSEADTRLLCDNVSVVFHCAATVKFDEPLKVSIQMNVIGTQRLMALCKRMDQLVCVVHASTAYANCNRACTEERIYTPCAHFKKVIEAAEWMNTRQLDSVAPHLLDARPNTYTFAKALAECQLHEDAQGLPLVVVRPSIIGAMWRDPLPGWTDNVNGPTGLFAAVGKGVLTNMCGKIEENADLIPVDIVSNTLIAAAAYRANLRASEKPETDAEAATTIPVIHCCSGELNPLKWGRIVIYLEQFFRSYPLEGCLRVPSTQFHTSRTAFLFNFYLKHYYPAYAIDLALRLMCRKPKLVKTYDKVWRMVETLHYFTNRGWQFESENIVKLWNSLSENDQKTYNFDIRKIDWDSYLFDYLMGLKMYLLKEKLENLPVAKTNLAWAGRVGFYTNLAGWAVVVRLLLWRRTRTERWCAWLTGVCAKYAFDVFGRRRPRVSLKSIDEYRKTALPAFA